MSKIEDRLVKALVTGYKVAGITKKQGQRFIYAFTGYMIASDPKQNTGENQNEKFRSVESN